MVFVAGLNVATQCKPCTTLKGLFRAHDGPGYMEGPWHGYRTFPATSRVRNRLKHISLKNGVGSLCFSGVGCCLRQQRGPHHHGFPNTHWQGCLQKTR